jgi:putative Holliday junction resolvase
MRFLGLDVGRRRLGLALSDASGTLARPWQTIAAGPTPQLSARAVGNAIEAARRDDLAVDAVVIGLPRRLNGEDTEQTALARSIGEALASETGLPVNFQDERLTSVEAESRLAVHERDWRRRKRQLDATAAAILLQDFLDAQPSGAGHPSSW